MAAPERDTFICWQKSRFFLQDPAVKLETPTAETEVASPRDGTQASNRKWKVGFGTQFSVLLQRNLLECRGRVLERWNVVSVSCYRCHRAGRTRESLCCSGPKNQGPQPTDGVV